jgi:uncharacterized protein (DUF697 family)
MIEAGQNGVAEEEYEEECMGEQTDIDEEKYAQAQERILYYTYGGMAMGLVPFPLLDLAALTALQLRMLHRLAEIYEVEFKANLGRSASTSLVGGLAPVVSAAPVAASLSKFIPGVGHVLSYGTLVALNGASTYAVGKVFARHFAAGGTFFTFDPEKARSSFTEQYEKGKEVVMSLKKKKKKKKDKGEASKEACAAG